MWLDYWEGRSEAERGWYAQRKGFDFPMLDPGVDNDCDGEAEVVPEALASYDSESSLEHCKALTLDASGSVDPDGTALSYDWEVLTVPSASALTTGEIEDVHGEQATCYPDTPGVFSFGLTITDEGGTSDSDTLTVTVSTRASNSAPTAQAGSDTTVTGTSVCTADGYQYDCEDCSFEGVFLDASLSDDSDGEPLSYLWSETGGTAGFDDDTAASPTVTLVGAEGVYGETVTDVYVFELEVKDCFGYVSTDEVTVTMACTGS